MGHDSFTKTDHATTDHTGIPGVSAAINFVTGTYLGDGTTDYSKFINLGFQPKQIIIFKWPNAVGHAICFKNDQMPLDEYFYKEDTTRVGCIIVTDGFQVADGETNESGVKFYYAAWG